MREFLADIVYSLHLLIFVPILLAFFYKSGPWLKYNLLIIPITLIDWHDYDNQCSLTALEAKLRGSWRPGAAESGEDAPAFFQPLLNKLLKPLNIKISRKTGGKINILLFLFAFLVSFVRFMNFHKFSFSPETSLGRAYVLSIYVFLVIWLINLFYSY